MDAFTLGLLIGYAVYGIIFGAICRWLAIEKNRSGSNWFIVGFFLGFIGLLMIGFAPALSGDQSNPREKSQKRPVTSQSLVQRAKTLYGNDRLKFVSVSALLAAFALWAMPFNIVVYEASWGGWLHFEGPLFFNCAWEWGQCLHGAFSFGFLPDAWYLELDRKSTRLNSSH